MRVVIGAYWERLRTSLWFLPAILVVGAIALALAMLEIDARTVLRGPRLGMGAEGARSILTAVAGSIITVAGVAFSITIVALSLTASQYSSRVLRNFMRDTTSQMVLGVLVGTFAYCLAVLRTIRGGEDAPFVPSLAIATGVGLALLAIGAFVYFIHHVATAIQAAQIVANVAAETLQAIERQFPDPLAGEEGEVAAPAAPRDGWTSIAASASGYLQRLDLDRLFACAVEHDLVVRVERHLGEFVIAGRPLLSVSGARLDPHLGERLCAAVAIDRVRTMEQDASYGVRQLVDVALKALSPGINDTTTAIMCVDWLAAILARVGDRRLGGQVRAEEGAVRVWVAGPDFADLLGQACDQIRQHASGNSAVLLRQAKALAALEELIAVPGRQRALREALGRVGETTRHSLPLAIDRAPIEAVLRDGPVGRPSGRDSRP